MTEQEVFKRLVPLVREVTGASEEQIAMGSVLVADLGAESIDLVDLSFLVEEEFGVTLEANEFERRVRERVPGGVFEREGELTEEALEELRRALPEVDPANLSSGLTMAALPSLLNVAVLVHLIQRKLAGASPEESHA